MAFPKLMQRLFQNDGGGDKLRPEIIPVDSELSATSSNAVGNSYSERLHNYEYEYRLLGQ